MFALCFMATLPLSFLWWQEFVSPLSGIQALTNKHWHTTHTPSVVKRPKAVKVIYVSKRFYVVLVKLQNVPH